jgi:hypothetical protein
VEVWHIDIAVGTLYIDILNILPPENIYTPNASLAGTKDCEAGWIAIIVPTGNIKTIPDNCLKHSVEEDESRACCEVRRQSFETSELFVPVIVGGNN